MESNFIRRNEPVFSNTTRRNCRLSNSYIYIYMYIGDRSERNASVQRTIRAARANYSNANELWQMNCSLYSPIFSSFFHFCFFFFCFFRSNEYSCSPPDVYASVLVFVGSSRVTMGVPHCSDGHRFDNGSTWWERILNGWKRWRSWNAGIERNACSGINISKYCNIPVAFYTNDLYQHRHLYIRILGSAV